MAAAGHLCVACLLLLRRFPGEVTAKILAPALLLYPLFRPRHAARLRACFKVLPFAVPPTLRGYYATRLDLLLRGLKYHGMPFAPRVDSSPSDGSDSIREWAPGLAVTVQGARHYQEALALHRPLALIGLHAGMVELLHRIPEAPEGRPFVILTAPAFSPPLTRFMAAGREMEGKRILWVGKAKTDARVDSDGNPGLRGFEQGLRTVLAANGVLALMADQHPGPPEECEYLTLWNRIQVPWPARLIRFLASRGFLCVPVSTRLISAGDAGAAGRSGATVRFEFHPILAQPTDEAIRGFLERAIAAAPEQWNWSYPKIRA